MGGVGGDQPLVEMQTVAELDRRRLVRDERVGPHFDNAVGDPLGPDHAPQARASLK